MTSPIRYGTHKPLISFPFFARLQQPVGTILWWALETDIQELRALGNESRQPRAVRINFSSTMPLTATTEVAPGKAAFGRPDKVTKYDPPSQATDIVYANKTWTFTSTSGSKWKLTGDGMSLSGQVDPRPHRPNIAFVKVNCR